MKTEERMSLQEAAEALGVSEQTARRWVKSGKLKAYKPGLKYLIPADAVEGLLEGAEAPKVLLPFDVEEVREEVFEKKKPETAKELQEAVDTEYARRLVAYSLEDLLAMEDTLRDQIKEAGLDHSKLLLDAELTRAFFRASDELRAVMVARVAKGMPSRTHDA